MKRIVRFISSILILCCVTACHTPSEAGADRDYAGVEYIAASSLDNTERLGWNSNWSIDALTFKDCENSYIPQAWSRLLLLEDICIRFFINHVDYSRDKYTLSELRDYIETADESNQIVNSNLEFINGLIEKQSNSITVIEDEEAIITVDFDHDGINEVLEIKKPLYLETLINEEMRQIYEYNLSVNGQHFFSIQNSRVKFNLLNVDTCTLLLVHPVGVYEGYHEFDTGFAMSVYFYDAPQMKLIGELNADYIDMVVGEGRFTTIGRSDIIPNDSPITYEAHEYIVTDGKLFHIRHGWQYTHVLWQLSADMPYYTEKDGDIATSPIPAGSRILIIGYYPDEWLYFVSEDEQRGVIRMNFDIEVECNPQVMPGGELMSDYLVGYSGCAN